jgi:hypothetical protein
LAARAAQISATRVWPTRAISQVQTPAGPAVFSTKPNPMNTPVVIEMNEKPMANDSKDRSVRRYRGQ